MFCSKYLVVMSYDFFHEQIQRVLSAGFSKALEIMESLENNKKVPCMEKSWNLKKPE